MTRDIFACRIYQGIHQFAQEQMAQMHLHALAVHATLNPNGQPWSRQNRQSLLSQLGDGKFKGLDELVRKVIVDNYACSIDQATAREVITYKGQFIPLHVEDTDLSAVYWLDTDARPDPERQDYSGAFVLVNPSGAYGSRKLPWEGWRSEIIHPKPGMLLVFPSYLAHHSHPYNGERPSVEIHFEFKVSPNSGVVQ